VPDRLIPFWGLSDLWFGSYDFSYVFFGLVLYFEKYKKKIKQRPGIEPCIRTSQPSRSHHCTAQFFCSNMRIVLLGRCGTETFTFLWLYGVSKAAVVHLYTVGKCHFLENLVVTSAQPRSVGAVFRKRLWGVGGNVHNIPKVSPRPFFLF